MCHRSAVRSLLWRGPTLDVLQTWEQFDRNNAANQIVAILKPFNPLVSPSRFWWKLFPEGCAQSGLSVRGPQPARGGLLLATGEDKQKKPLIGGSSCLLEVILFFLFSSPIRWSIWMSTKGGGLPAGSSTASSTRWRAKKLLCSVSLSKKTRATQGRFPYFYALVFTLIINFCYCTSPFGENGFFQHSTHINFASARFSTAAFSLITSCCVFITSENHPAFTFPNIWWTKGPNYSSTTPKFLKGKSFRTWLILASRKTSQKEVNVYPRWDIISFHCNYGIEWYHPLLTAICWLINRQDCNH